MDCRGWKDGGRSELLHHLMILDVEECLGAIAMGERRDQRAAPNMKEANQDLMNCYLPTGPLLFDAV